MLIVIPAMSAEAGAEQSLFAVTPHLLDSGVEVQYAILSEHQGLVPALRDLGVPVHDVSGKRIPQQVLALRSIVRNQRPDLVHATLFQASMRSQLSLLGSKVPVLVTWANTPLDPRVEGLSVWKIRAVKTADRLLGRLTRTRYHAVTQGVAKTKATEMHVPMDSVRVAERGRDAAQFRPVDPVERARIRASLGVDDDAVLVLALGRQEPQKGYPELLRAFDRAAARDPHVRLVIAGREGSASAEIRAVLPMLAFADRVAMLGHRDDVSQLLAAADLVVCASHREGAAGALIEAMASGVPVLSVELDGMRGILVHEQNALVVPRTDLEEGIVRMAGDADLRRRLASAARVDFLERFTIERSATALAGVYQWAAER